MVISMCCSSLPQGGADPTTDYSIHCHLVGYMPHACFHPMHLYDANLCVCARVCECVCECVHNVGCVCVWQVVCASVCDAVHIVLLWLWVCVCLLLSACISVWECVCACMSLSLCV